jgi:hypothetical protein
MIATCSWSLYLEGTVSSRDAESLQQYHSAAPSTITCHHSMSSQDQVNVFTDSSALALDALALYAMLLLCLFE